MSEQSISEIAAEAYGWFETATRPDGEATFVRLKDGAPEWISELVRAAHGEFLPDDWRYEAIRSAVGAIADDGENVDLDDYEHEWADSYTDAYTLARFAWLGSHIQRQFYVDDAASEYGSGDTSVAVLVGLGQYMEAREVFASVRSSLEERVDVSAEVGS